MRNNDLLIKQDFQRLLNAESTPCVSIYLPTQKNQQDNREDWVRLKNRLSDAEEQLRDRKVGHRDQFLKPAYELLDDAFFWNYLSHGLALFIAPGFFRCYRVPITVPEITQVSEKFHIKPLAPLIAEDSQFLILALSQKNVRLISCTRYHAGEIALRDVPTSMAEALALEEKEQSLQYHFGSSGSGKQAIYHGQGVVDDDHKEKILQFFHQVDRGLEREIPKEGPPMILAGVDFLLPLYQSTNSYPHVVEDKILGNPDEKSTDDLHQEALPIIEHHIEHTREQAIDAYRRLSQTEPARVADDLDEILQSAHQGRNQTIFAAQGDTQWGYYDFDHDQLITEPQPNGHNYDLVDLAVTQTMRTQGRAFVIPKSEMPSGSPVAAIYRY